MKRNLPYLLILVALVFSGCVRPVPAPVPRPSPAAPSDTIIQLPEPKLESSVSLEEALLKRRSVREYADATRWEEKTISRSSAY